MSKRDAKLIGILQGHIVDREDNLVCLMSGGVGREVLCTLNALTHISQSSDSASDVRLWTHLVVREDVLQLYGFSDKKERALFRELIRISGVGPKVALSILSGMDVKGLVQAIHQGDAVQLTKIPGIGKKTAERLVVEMRDRLTDWQIGSSSADDASAAAVDLDLVGEAEAALIALGYKPVDATKMLAALDTPENMSVEDLIRAALQSRLRS